MSGDRPGRLLDDDWPRRASAAAAMLPVRVGIGGHRDYTPFVIIGDRRTGTNLLLHLLTSTGAVAGFAELFSKVRPFWAGRSFAPIRHAHAQRVRDERPSDFLDTFVFRRYPDRIRAAGFKAHYDQLGTNDEALHHLRSTQGLVVLHIRRIDAVAIHVSRLVAQRTGQRLQRSSTPDGPRVSVHVEIADLERFLTTYDANADWPSLHLPDATRHDLTYESLTANQHETLRPICETLGLDPLRARPLTRRQNNAGWRSTIDNVDEVERFLRSSPWAHLAGHPT